MRSFHPTSSEKQSSTKLFPPSLHENPPQALTLFSKNNSTRYKYTPRTHFIHQTNCPLEWQTSPPRRINNTYPNPPGASKQQGLEMKGRVGKIPEKDTEASFFWVEYHCWVAAAAGDDDVSLLRSLHHPSPPHKFNRRERSYRVRVLSTDGMLFGVKCCLLDESQNIDNL